MTARWNASRTKLSSRRAKRWSISTQNESRDGISQSQQSLLRIEQRRVELVGDVAESVQPGLGDRVDSRLQFPEGVHHFVLSSTQKHRPDAVGHGEAVFQLEALASLKLSSFGFSSFVSQSCLSALERLRGQLEAGGALRATRRRVVGCDAEVAPGVLDGALAAVVDADHSL